jgi:predicted nucleotidyltransferase
MDKTAVIKILARFHKEIEARGIRPLKVILYGSYASDSNREGSDIDIVVISDDFKYKSYWERIDILSDVIYEIFAPIEAIALTQDEWDNEDSFVVDFARNGEVLFAA